MNKRQEGRPDSGFWQLCQYRCTSNSTCTQIMGLPIRKEKNKISYVIWNAPKREDTTQRVNVMWSGLTGEGEGRLFMWCRVLGLKGKTAN